VSLVGVRILFECSHVVALWVPPELKHFVQEARIGSDAFHWLPFCVLILTTAQHEGSLLLDASKMFIESVNFHRGDARRQANYPESR
jgi:hypothetical protein